MRRRFLLPVGFPLACTGRSLHQFSYLKGTLAVNTARIRSGLITQGVVTIGESSTTQASKLEAIDLAENTMSKNFFSLTRNFLLLLEIAVNYTVVRNPLVFTAGLKSASCLDLFLEASGNQTRLKDADQAIDVGCVHKVLTVWRVVLLGTGWLFLSRTTLDKPWVPVGLMVQETADISATWRCLVSRNRPLKLLIRRLGG